MFCGFLFFCFDFFTFFFLIFFLIRLKCFGSYRTHTHDQWFPNIQIKDISWLSLIFGITNMIDIQVTWSYMLYWGNNSFIQFTFAVLDKMDMSGKHNLTFLCSWSLHLRGEMSQEHQLFWHVDSIVRGIQEHWCLFLIWGFWIWNNTREWKRTWENPF